MKAVVATTVIGGAIAGALTASAALNLPTQSCSYVFNSNMRLGSRGTDVMNLQKVLNMYPQTQVAASGVGSSGMESSYFGPATRAAVNKFHALHLAELGIAAPTGNVFGGTRALLNQICAGEGMSSGNTGTNMSSLPTGCTSTAGYSPVTGQSCSTGATNNTNTTTGGAVSASLASSQPMGMVVAGQTGAALANIMFTGNGSVTKVVLQRTGVSTDSSLPNVYLYDGNTRITDAASVVTGGYITFSSPSGLFSVNGSRTITVRADICTTTSCGSTIVGQAIGVKLNSITSGGVESTYTNVMGNYLTVSGVSLATVQLGTIDSTAKSVDAGTLNYNVWSNSVSIGTRDTLLRAMTFKYVGSAPLDSVQNISLYVDGTKVAGPAIVDAANNNKLTFDLGANPFVLKSGSHTVDVRGDIVKGSSFNFYFYIENSADLMVEDSNLSNVAIAATVGASTAISSSNTKFGTVSVNNGSVTVNVDPAFNPTTITGGSTNMPIAQFTLKGYGEDVKVNSLTITPVATGAVTGGLNNVSLFLNGGQIGTSQNWTSTSTGLTFTLGSSLIVPAGQTVTLTVKADIVKPLDSSAYTSGTVTATVSGSSNAQGVNSNQVVSVGGASGVTDQAITVSSGSGTFARTSGFVSGTVAPNSTAVKVGSFTIQAGTAEDLVVNSAQVALTYAGSPTMTSVNVSNLTLKTGSTVLGTPVGTSPTQTVAGTAASSTFSFADITIPMNTTKTFDVYADLGSATGTVYADMSLSTRGAVSRIASTATAGGSGAVISPVQATLAATTLVASSPIAQYVVGGTTFGVATFKIKTSVGDATLTKISLGVVGTDSVSTIKVGNTTAAVVNGSSTVTGLSIPVTTTGTDVPVTITFAGFKNSTNGGALTASVDTVRISVHSIEAQSGSGATISESTVSSSNDMTLVASKPTITGNNYSGTLAAGTQKIAEFTVAADANGAISVSTTSLVISTSTSGSLIVTNVKLSDDNGATALANSNTVAAPLSGVAFDLGFGTTANAYQISAGQSKTFQVWGTISGSFGAVGTTQLSTQLNPTLSNFKWIDTVSSSTKIMTGSGIQNFPVTSYTLKN